MDATQTESEERADAALHLGLTNAAARIRSNITSPITSTDESPRGRRALPIRHGREASAASARSRSSAAATSQALSETSATSPQRRVSFMAQAASNFVTSARKSLGVRMSLTQEVETTADAIPMQALSNRRRSTLNSAQTRPSRLATTALSRPSLGDAFTDLDYAPQARSRRRILSTNNALSNLYAALPSFQWTAEMSPERQTRQLTRVQRHSLMGYRLLVASLMLGALSTMTITGLHVLFATNYRDTVWVVAGCYLLLIISMIAFMLNRYVTTRWLLRDIPKIYVPINQEDIPQNCFDLIHKEIERVSAMDLSPLPSQRGHTGWSDNVTPPIHYKQAVATSQHVLIESILSVWPQDGHRQPHQSMQQYLSQIAERSLPYQRIDPRLIAAYCDVYERAVFGSQELDLQDYEMCMRLIVLLVKNFESIKKALDQQQHAS